MDPNATLKEMLELAEDVIRHNGSPDHVDTVRLAELVEAMNGWIMKGGFLPKAWREANEGFDHNK